MDYDCIYQILNMINNYVEELMGKEQPGNLSLEMQWPPKWVQEWEELTEPKLWQ